MWWTEEPNIVPEYIFEYCVHWRVHEKTAGKKSHIPIHRTSSSIAASRVCSFFIQPILGYEFQQKRKSNIIDSPKRRMQLQGKRRNWWIWDMWCLKFAGFWGNWYFYRLFPSTAIKYHSRPEIFTCRYYWFHLGFISENVKWLYLQQISIHFYTIHVCISIFKLIRLLLSPLN